MSDLDALLTSALLENELVEVAGANESPPPTTESVAAPEAAVVPLTEGAAVAAATAAANPAKSKTESKKASIPRS